MKNDASILDKYVKLNYGMVKSHMAGSLVTAIIGGAAIFLDIFVGGIILIITAIALICVSYSAMKRLFYTTMYEKGALIYNMLPVSYGEAVITKVLLATAVVYLPSMAMTAMIMGRAAIVPGNLLAALGPFALGDGDLGTSQWYVPVLFMLSIALMSFCETAVIFLAVTIFNTVPRANRSALARVGMVFCVWLVLHALSRVEPLGMTAGLNPVLIQAIYSLICLIAGAAACKGTEKLLAKKYFLN